MTSGIAGGEYVEVASGAMALGTLSGAMVLCCVGLLNLGCELEVRLRDYREMR